MRYDSLRIGARWWHWLVLLGGSTVLLFVLFFFSRAPGFWQLYFFKDLTLDRIPNTSIYVDPALSQMRRKHVLRTYLDAGVRLQMLWTKLQATPVLIVQGDQKAKSTHAATTYFSGFGTYIVLDTTEINTDVLAHELAHAELVQRLGWQRRNDEIPTWFDEGLAMLVDERFPDWEYDLLLMLRSGREIPELNELETPEGFFTPSLSGDLFNYFVAKRVVKDWFQVKKRSGLEQLLNDIRSGKSFQEIFWDK